MGLNAWADKLDFGPNQAKRSEKRKQLAVELEAIKAERDEKRKQIAVDCAAIKAEHGEKRKQRAVDWAAHKAERDEKRKAANKGLISGLAAIKTDFPAETKGAIDGIAAIKASQGILFEGKSHEEGRNAKVTLYADRIERIKERSRMSVSSAKQDAEVTPIRSVTSVQAKKDSLMWTIVTVYASGNNIDFRFGHDEAHRFRDAITQLILNPGGGTQAAPASAAPDVLDQLKKLGELRDAGVLTAAEFDAKKADLLKRF